MFPVRVPNVLRSRSRLTLALLLAGGGTAIFSTRLAKQLRQCRAKQIALTALSVSSAVTKPNADQSEPSKSSARVAVDVRFLRRLLNILKVCVPGIFTREVLLLATQLVMMIARTLLSDRITALEGVCAQNVTARNWDGFRRVLIGFALNTIPASIVNSALKALEVFVQISFRLRLTRFLHRLYMGNRAYYAASVLGGLSHPDQRISDDVDKFSEAIAELASYTFKPLLDVIVFSRSLARIIGYKTQIGLYGYFIIMGSVLRAISPPLGRMTAEYASLNADFCTSHHRVANHAESIAFNDPPSGRAEMQALNVRIERTVTHSALSVFQRFVQQCIDGYFVKYTASIIGLIIFAIPLYYTPVTQRSATNVIAGQYIKSMRLMMQASSAMGQLVLCYKRINSLAGHTARVAELIEKVSELGKPSGHLDAFRKVQERVASSKKEGEGYTEGVSSQDDITNVAFQWSPKRKAGKTFSLEHVHMWSPDGSALVRDLTFEVLDGTSVIILGPNGSGKSSILRMLAGLWPLQAGTVTLPARSEVFYLSQRPYMYSGSLKEQLMYPRLPGVIVGETIIFDGKRAQHCLDCVELGNMPMRCGGFDGKLAWEDALSGGERNRLAVARLLYHKPRFAVLDECTAAVSADGEVVLYEAMASAGITLLSVAHRKAVMNYHKIAVVLDGCGGWEIRKLENEGTNGVDIENGSE